MRKINEKPPKPGEVGLLLTGVTDDAEGHLIRLCTMPFADIGPLFGFLHERMDRKMPKGWDAPALAGRRREEVRSGFRAEQGAAVIESSLMLLLWLIWDQPDARRQIIKAINTHSHCCISAFISNSDLQYSIGSEYHWDAMLKLPEFQKRVQAGIKAALNGEEW